MQSIIDGLIQTFGIGEIPTDFPSFIHWLCVVVAALIFVQIILGTVFCIYSKALEVNK